MDLVNLWLTRFQLILLVNPALFWYVGDRNRKGVKETMELHERIALARKQAGMTQEQLGERLGVSRQAVSKWEAGQTNPDLAYVVEMCRLFGVSSDWLLLGEEGSQENTPAQCPVCHSVVTKLDRFCPSCGRNLQGREDTYTLVLRESSFYTSDDLQGLSKMDMFGEDSPLHLPLTQTQASNLACRAPCVLATGLERRQVEEIMEKLHFNSSFAIYRSCDGEDIQRLTELSPVPVPSREFQRPKEPLSFGMVVLAVVLAVLLLSFL